MAEKIWVIAFKDIQEELYKYELLDNNGNFVGFGHVLRFKSEKDADNFIMTNLDNRAYDYYPTQKTEKEIFEYETEKK